jgi:hypothetical protein
MQGEGEGLMESLYVCLFSNGHVKVGRSIDADSRIAQHADRVACLGVELSDRFTVDCERNVAQREALLIAKCAESAERRFQSEWFSGLDFLCVCEWAQEIAAMSLEQPRAEEDSFGSRLRKARMAAGLTQAELGKGAAFDGGDVLKAAISTWENGRNFPNVMQLRILCERLNVSADHLIGLKQSA